MFTCYFLWYILPLGWLYTTYHLLLLNLKHLLTSIVYSYTCMKVYPPSPTTTYSKVWAPIPPKYYLSLPPKMPAAFSSLGGTSVVRRLAVPDPWPFSWSSAVHEVRLAWCDGMDVRELASPSNELRLASWSWWKMLGEIPRIFWVSLVRGFFMPILCPTKFRFWNWSHLRKDEIKIDGQIAQRKVFLPRTTSMTMEKPTI